MPSETKNLLLQKFLIQFRKRQHRDYNKIKGRSFSMSFDTVGRVGCAETHTSGEPQESRGAGKACAYEVVTVSFLPGAATCRLSRARCRRPAVLVSTLCHASCCDFNLPSCATIPAACGAHVLCACHAVAGYPC